MVQSPHPQFDEIIGCHSFRTVLPLLTATGTFMFSPPCHLVPMIVQPKLSDLVTFQSTNILTTLCDIFKRQTITKILIAPSCRLYSVEPRLRLVAAGGPWPWQNCAPARLFGALIVFQVIQRSWAKALLGRNVWARPSLHLNGGWTLRKSPGKYITDRCVKT